MGIDVEGQPAKDTGESCSTERSRSGPDDRPDGVAVIRRVAPGSVDPKLVAYARNKSARDWTACEAGTELDACHDAGGRWIIIHSASLGRGAVIYLCPEGGGHPVRYTGRGSGGEIIEGDGRTARDVLESILGSVGEP